MFLNKDALVKDICDGTCCFCKYMKRCLGPRRHVTCTNRMFLRFWTDKSHEETQTDTQKETQIEKENEQTMIKGYGSVSQTPKQPE